MDPRLREALVVLLLKGINALGSRKVWAAVAASLTLWTQMQQGQLTPVQFAAGLVTIVVTLIGSITLEDAAKAKVILPENAS